MLFFRLVLLRLFTGFLCCSIGSLFSLFTSFLSFLNFIECPFR